mmetsp:Transcript_15073/g.20186  ORF Transcript_15073/g.20186 Transcript_15073/m.20186 type:complete len:119 (-) Transcript_15073:406-762(-)
MSIHNRFLTKSSPPCPPLAASQSRDKTAPSIRFRNASHLFKPRSTTTSTPSFYSGRNTLENAAAGYFSMLNITNLFPAELVVFDANILKPHMTVSEAVVSTRRHGSASTRSCPHFPSS